MARCASSFCTAGGREGSHAGSESEARPASRVRTSALGGCEGSRGPLGPDAIRSLRAWPSEGSEPGASLSASLRAADATPRRHAQPASRGLASLSEPLASR